MEASILSAIQQSVCLIVRLFVCVWLWYINIENTRNMSLLKNFNHCTVIVEGQYLDGLWWHLFLDSYPCFKKRVTWPYKHTVSLQASRFQTSHSPLAWSLTVSCTIPWSFPARLVATHLYWPDSLTRTCRTKSTPFGSNKCLVSFLITTLFLLHVTRGLGFPLTVHTNIRL